MIFLLIAVLAFLIVLDVPKLVRGKQKRELAVLGACLLATLAYGMVYVLRLDVGTPNGFLYWLYKDVFRISYRPF